MLAKRIIPCLDVKSGRVVKGINFLDLRDAGNPVELAKLYNDEGADELVFLDITASHERRDILKTLVRNVAKEIDIPFTVGGGIRRLDDVREILRNGADKTAINTAAVERPELITEIAEVFGKQCVVVAIDVKRNYSTLNGEIIIEENKETFWYEVFSYGGRKPTGIDAVHWAKQAVNLGAGELLITSMDRDGTKSGFDNTLNRIISTTVNVPLVASGGAGEPEHFYEAFIEGKADAVLAASVFHYNYDPIPVIKQYLQSKGVNVRFENHR